MVEHLPEEQSVGGSIPSLGTILRVALQPASYGLRQLLNKYNNLNSKSEVCPSKLRSRAVIKIKTNHVLCLLIKVYL